MYKVIEGRNIRYAYRAPYNRQYSKQEAEQEIEDSQLELKILREEKLKQKQQEVKVNGK